MKAREAKIKIRKKELKLELARKKIEITKEMQQEEGHMECAVEVQVDNGINVVYQQVKLQEEGSSPSCSRSPRCSAIWQIRTLIAICIFGQ